MMILRKKNYRYPSKEEWLASLKSFPPLSQFGFSRIDEFIELFQGKKSIEDVYFLQNLLEWDSILSKKIWNLREAYGNAVTYYNRGIAIDSSEFKDELKVIHLFQYEFYCEITFYYLISVRDIILQIINLAFRLGLSESAIKVSSVTSQLKCKSKGALFEQITEALGQLSEANEIRNSTAHRFSKLNSDHRSSLSEDRKTYGAGTGDFVEYGRQIKIINESLEALSVLLSTLKNEMIEMGFQFEKRSR